MSLSSSAPPAGSRSVAGNAFRKAGLMDRDERMRDATDKPGGRKGHAKANSHKVRSSFRTRGADAVLGKDASGSSTRNTLAARLAAQMDSEGISIKGASKTVGAAAGRIRRNAISLNGDASSRSSNVGSRVVELWREFVHKRYNPEAKFLNLERMHEDEFLRQNHLHGIGARGGSVKEASVIYKLAGSLKPMVETVSFAHNDIQSGLFFSSLHHYLPNIANLSLEGNKLSTWRDLDYISGRRGKLEHLRELILRGNPIRELEYQNNRIDQYKSEITRRFPTLEILDQEPVAKIAFDAPHASTSGPVQHQHPTSTAFPVEMGPSFFTGVDPAIISAFLSRFFPLFDSQRSELVSAYHPSGTFSFSVNTTIPTRARLEGFHHTMPNQRKMTWEPWIGGGKGGSRNLARMYGGGEKLVQTLHVGGEEAVKAMTNLPKTKHDVSGSPEKFCIDAFPVSHADSTALLVTVHGQFTELPSEGIRSFDRSFVLVPAPAGSRAKQNGWDIMILSDELLVRHFSSHEAWRPGPMKVQAGDNPAAPAPTISGPAPMLTPQAQAQIQEGIASIPEPQRSLVLQVCQRTGLNVRFAVDCLGGNGWNIDRALANFEEVKTTLSREAFL